MGHLYVWKINGLVISAIFRPGGMRARADKEWEGRTATFQTIVSHLLNLVQSTCIYVGRNSVQEFCSCGLCMDCIILETAMV